MTATREAERCLSEIASQTTKLQSARSAASAAQGTLSAAQAQGKVARAAGALGAPAAVAADAQATTAQGALFGAQQDEQAANAVLERAQDDLRMWQARGRRAWDDAQAAADRATGTMQGLAIVPPPLAGVAPLVPFAPFALPREQCGSGPGEGEDPGFGEQPGLLPYTTPDEPPWTENYPGFETTPGDGVLAYTLPGELPRGEDLPATERTPGENITTDPAGEPCGRQQVNSQSGGIDLSGATTVRGKFPPNAQPGEVLVRRDPRTGQPTNYEVYGPDGLPVKRVDLVGQAHDGIPTPHVHEYGRNTDPETGEVFVNRGPVRGAEPGEIP